MKTNHQAALAMKEFGGSFMKCIGEAYLRGDTINRAKLETAFAEEFEEYKNNFVKE